MREVPQPEKPKQTWLDKAIGFVSPSWALKREEGRQRLELARSQSFSVYQAASSGDRTGQNWLASRLSPDSALESDLETMRERSEELYRDDPTVSAFVESRVSKVIGVGMRPQALIQPKEGLISEEDADRWNGQLEDVFNRLAPHIDFNGVLSFQEIQRQDERQWTVCGDAFVRFRARSAVDKPIPLALEVIPANRVATPIGMEGDENVRLGIRYGADGRRVGYYVLKDPPNDSLKFSQDYEFVPATDPDTGLPLMVHLYDQLVPGQSRGIPAITPVLSRIKDLKDLTEAVVIREQVKACFSVFIKTAGDPYDVATGKATDVSVGGYRIQNMAPGRVDYLGANQDVTFADPGNGGSEYAPFMANAKLEIAAALNWPHSWLTKDYRQSTYSSERMALIDGSGVVETRQQTHSLRLLHFVWQYICDQAMLTGELDVDPDFYWMNRQAMQNHSWIPPGVPWIDPKKDVEASILAVQNNFDTRSNIIARTGLDPEAVMAARSREKEWDKQWEIQPADEKLAEAEAESLVKTADAAVATAEREPQEAGA